MRNILQRFKKKEFNISKVNFIKQQDSTDGLEHYNSPIPPSITTVAGEANEIFYDAQSNRTMIRCSNTIRHIPPHDGLTFCEHYFFTPDGSISIEVANIRDKQYYLSRWRETEGKIAAMFNSFIVK
jgi:hypothetical protein